MVKFELVSLAVLVNHLSEEISGLPVLKAEPQLPLWQSNCAMLLLVQPSGENYDSIEFGVTVCWFGNREYQRS